MDLTSLDALADSLEDAANAIEPAIDAAMSAAMADLAAYVRDDELSGQVLNARSGRLRDSLQAAVGGGETGVSGIVIAKTPYAAIQEYGGVIELTPRHQAGRRLRQPGPGRIVEPERSYLRQALTDRSDEISAALAEAVMEVLS